MKHKRLWFWFVLVVAVAAAVCWLFYLPYMPVRLYAAMPPDARLVTEHRDLHRHWRPILAHPLVRTALVDQGVDADTLDAIAADADVDAAVRLYAGRHVLFGYVPAFGMSGHPAWVGVSWLGARAQLLRLWLFLGLVEGFEKVRMPDDRYLWVKRGERLPEGTALSVTVSEGTILMALSRDPFAAGYLLRRSEESSQPVDVLQARLAEDGADGEASGPGRVWLRWYHRQPGRFVYRSVAVRIEEWNAQQVVFSAETPGDLAPWLPAAPAAGAVDGNALPDRIGDATLVLPGSGLAAWSRTRLEALALPVTAALVANTVDPERPCFATLFSGESGGRLLGFRVPALVAGVPVTGPVSADALAGMLDELNARHRWGLILQGDANGAMFGIGSSRSRLFNSLAPRDRPAVANVDGWLLAATSRSALEAALADAAPRLSALAADGASPACFRMDGARLAGAARNAVAVYSLSLIASDPAARAEMRPRLEAVQTAADYLAVLGDIDLRAARHADRVTLHLRATTAPEDRPAALSAALND